MAEGLGESISPHDTYAGAAAFTYEGAGPPKSKRPPPRCIQCKDHSSKALMPLKCEIHHLCWKCLQEKARRDGPDDMYVCDVRECTSTGAKSKLPIQMFVDNSNIWIEAKKLGAEMKHFTSPNDHRVRINYGPLTDVVANGRDAYGTLYGSRPPDIDPVWNKIRQHGWKVKVLEKSFHTRKEKEVDATILKDILALVRVPPSKRSTVVLISGDRDMRPAVKEILQKAKGWKIEICMWKRSISHGLKELTGQYENLSIMPLNEHWKKVVYTENVAPEHLESDDSSAVLTITRGKFKNERIDQIHPTWWETLEQLTQWPVQYKWMEPDEARHLMLVFRGLGRHKTSSLVQKLNENKHCLHHVERAEMYADFKQRQERGPTKPVIREEGWNEVVRRSTPTPVRTVQPQPVCARKEKCCSGKNCEDGSNCNYYHDKDDIKHFNRNNGAGNPRRKTRQCKDYPKCKFFSIRCNFAHEESERWCSKCHKMGHFCEKCPNPECRHPKHTQT